MLSFCVLIFTATIYPNTNCQGMPDTWNISTTLGDCSTYPGFLNATGAYNVSSGSAVYAPLLLIVVIVSFLLA